MIVLFSILTCFWFKLPFTDRYRDIFIRIYPFLMNRILPIISCFWLSHFRYRPNKNLYERKWGEGFLDRFHPYEQRLSWSLPSQWYDPVKVVDSRFVAHLEACYVDKKCGPASYLPIGCCILETVLIDTTVESAHKMRRSKGEER
jgi:hypothetical protein